MPPTNASPLSIAGSAVTDGVIVTRDANVDEILLVVPVTFVAEMETIRYLPAADESTTYDDVLWLVTNSEQSAGTEAGEDTCAVSQPYQVYSKVGLSCPRTVPVAAVAVIPTCTEPPIDGEPTNSGAMRTASDETDALYPVPVRLAPSRDGFNTLRAIS